ncbi:uncharacterized protein B0H18DRAFT_825165, partial [Fomitopsis serialis]|uniref:uncharacterized protein n=1 Tax=Fomitopsis serialis TaxID=139415 RepID=UPI0020074B77
MGHYITKEVKQLALKMSLERHLSDKWIRDCTGISRRTLKRLRKLYRDTGEVIRKPFATGRPRILDGLDASFVEGLVERQPDISLIEL